MKDRKMLQCDHCGIIWELEDKYKGALCNCGSEMSDCTVVMYNEDKDFVYDIK